jgi:hypothetical protein
MSLNAAVRGIIGASSMIARVIGAGDRRRGAVLDAYPILVAAFAAICITIGVPGARAFFMLLGHKVGFWVGGRLHRRVAGRLRSSQRRWSDEPAAFGGKRGVPNS